MTKQAAILAWSQPHNAYLWYDSEHSGPINLPNEQELWLKQLPHHSSFSFQGMKGHLTLLKETRPRGDDGYWYAYRRQGKRTAKKYAGRTADLTTERLEQVARVLRCSPEQTHQDTANGDARGAGDGREWRTTDRAGQQQNSLSSARETPLLVPKFQLPPQNLSLSPRKQAPLR